ncbi:polyphosphate kinase [Geoalkalibacter ferrihydriticus]|uniref:Polyphosphate kinase n=1 Tax=Geoalkalibacter ferrihydriticus TaxID=392333 RepID=A0A1G9JHJ9_9BACT|nr:polyphosphate kinase [Geoalkalibacter ferrihydriticus]
MDTGQGLGRKGADVTRSISTVSEAKNADAKGAQTAISEPEQSSQRRISEVDPRELFLNRELTWLQFNRRVLHEAADERNPLLERAKFLAITSSNLDEFFMKRIGGLKQQLGAGMTELTVDGRTPRQQIEESYVLVREMVKDMQSIFAALKKELRAAGIAILAYDELTARERQGVRDYYYQNIYPLVTPQSIDPAHPFPFISNLSLNLLVTLKYPQDGEMSMARVKVPVGPAAPRFIRIGEKNRFVPLEEVMSHNLDMLFPEMEVVSCEFFRVTRNANTEKNEEHAEDLLAMIESELRERKFAPIVRMQTYRGMDPVHRGRLAAELGLDETEDVFEIDGFMALRDLWEIHGLDFPELKDTPHHPIDHPGLQASRKVFHMIRESGAILLQHPYESFSTSVERFLQEAARDSKVRAIKMTLYRTESESRIVDYLIDAAGNGKQVAVVVELKARFDEAANIRLASRMEEAGIHVTYGVVGLKTHAKVIQVVRQDFSGLRRYMHLGTGNYHAGTSRIYSDVGLLTCDEQIGRDTTELFNYLTTGYTPKRNYQKILPAPKICKRALLARIEREIALHRPEQPGLIQFKMNALDDMDVVKALYQASQAGVPIDLLVRDTCRLRPGVAGLSETVRVISIIGRFLEHTRLYYFRSGGDEEYFIGSADAMKRNLESRVEVLVPVESPDLRRDLRAMLDIQLADRRTAWDMLPDGSYVQRLPETPEQEKGSHQLLIELAEKRQKDITRLRKRKSKHFGGRNLR